MFKVNTDLSIEITRGDAVEFVVTAQENGENYVFKSGDIVRFKVFEKKGCDCVVLQKDFGVESDTEEVTIVLEEADTKIGELIHKPKDYWYEVELNPDTLPYTIIGYDADGAKVFKLYPEGRDLGADPITPEDIPFVDKELDMTSHNPVENQTIVKEFDKVNDRIQQNADAVAQELANKLSTSGGTMVGNLSMGRKKLTGLTDPENDSDAVSLGYAKRAYVPKSHLKDNENPHNVTAEQVGARPNTWMPTANDVGARSNTWMPTASDVGARPDSWMPTAKEVGARPSTWTPTAAQVGARPDTWMPTANDVGAVPTTRKVNGKALSANITLSASDVGARPSTWMPTAANVGAAPSGLVLQSFTANSNSEITEALTTVFNSMGNDTVGYCHIHVPTSGLDLYDTSWYIEIRRRNTTYATVTAKSILNNYTMQRALVGGNWQDWEWFNPPMVAGKEYRTAERYRAKVVYVQLVNLGSMPNKTVKNITFKPTNIADRISCELMMQLASSNYTETCPAVGTSISYIETMATWLGNNTDSVIRVATKYDRSSYTGFALCKYTKG